MSINRATTLVDFDEASKAEDYGSPAAYTDLAEEYRDRQLPGAMTVDVEDYFHVSAFENHIDRNHWKDIPYRLPRNVDLILELFDLAGVQATFFTLGWVCEQMPEVVRRIAAEGHEIASHGYGHQRVWTKTRAQFMEDVDGTRKLLEDVTSAEVIGYRAPSFSIVQDTMWAYDILQCAGYEYSSSIFPIAHDHYGLPTAPRFPFQVKQGGLLEVPLSTVRRFGRNWPCAGGGYFRLLPLTYSIAALRHVLVKERMPAVFYFHPWELDPDQPRVKNIPLNTRFRHYFNLNRMRRRLNFLLHDQSWGRMRDIFLGY